MHQLRKRWAKDWAKTAKLKPAAKAAKLKPRPVAQKKRGETKKAKIAQALAAGRTATHVFGIQRPINLVADARGDVQSDYDELADA